MLERRRSRRVDVKNSESMYVAVRAPMQFMDISLSGALVACDVLFPAGTRGRIRLGLPSAPFNAAVELRREHSLNRKTMQSLCGANFTSMDDVSRGTLEQFLRRGTD